MRGANSELRLSGDIQTGLGIVLLAEETKSALPFSLGKTPRARSLWLLQSSTLQLIGMLAQ
jgi:hypothetical protein